MAARGRAVIGARGDFNGMVRRMTLWAMVQGASGPVNVAIEHNGKGQRAKRRLALRRGQVTQGGEGLARQVLLDPGPFGAKQMLIALEDHVRQPRSSRAKGLPPQMADTGHGIAHAAIGQCGRGNGLDRGRRETFPGGGHWGGEKRTSDGPFPPPTHTTPHGPSLFIGHMYTTREEAFTEAEAKVTPIAQEDAWTVVDSYFRENSLVRQQLDSYNQFIEVLS